MIRKEVLLPKIYKGNGTSDSQWFIYYSILKPGSGTMVRFRIYDGFKELKTIEEKEAHADKLLKKWRRKLLNGYNPFFEQDQIKYASRIKYDFIAAKTGRIVETEKNISYYVSVYLDYIKQDKKLRPATWTTYKSKLRIFCQWLDKKEIGNCQIRFYDIETIKLFNTYLRQNRTSSGKTLNQYNVTLHGFFEYLIKEKKNVCHVNPVNGIMRYEEKSTHHKAYSAGYIDKIKERVSESDPWLWLMIKVLFNTLLRPTELRYLQMKHFDWVDGLIHLPGEISKNHNDRTITLPMHLLEDLRESGYDKVDREMYLFGANRKPDVKHASKNFLYNQMKDILIELGVPKGFTLYSWKHTGVQQLAKKKVSLMFIKAQLGHASYDQMIPYIEELLAQGNEEIRYDAPRL
ncbi:MAG: site-specific integrase [Lentimicrobium sp.]|nr:site-specific integrase [Lentimicrobium sp.]